MRKRILLLTILMSVTLTFTGCNGGSMQQESQTDAAQSTGEEAKSESEADKDETQAEDSAANGKEEDDTEVSEAEESDTEVRSSTEGESAEESLEEIEEVVVTPEELANMNSVEFAELLGFGWNLGNTLDANSESGLDSETCWFQPKTTQEMISYIKEAGFTTIRIPVSWGNHTDDDFQIDKEWMARVKEVVDYAYNADLYVIINSHHDNDFYYPTEENYDRAEKYLTTIWSQIADEFKDYDNRLVFESMNEPRLAGTDIEWWFAMSDPKGKAAIGEICKLNQAFVDTIRAGEGNNPNRFLLVPSYAANPDFALNSAFSMPEDPADKVMLSVHAYTPYEFAGSANGYSDWDGSKNHEFNFMGKLKAMFINEGYGVVIGEFGCTNKGNDKDRQNWAKAYCSKASSYGIPCIVWDNGATGVGEENFGIVDRENLSIYFPELLDAYLKGYAYGKGIY